MRESNDTLCVLNVRLKSSRSVSIGIASRIGTIVMGLVLVLATCASAGVFSEETVAERFDKAMKKRWITAGRTKSLRQTGVATS